MTNDIILTTKDHEFANTVIDDGVGVADLDFTFKIQRRLDDKYWNDTSKEWQVASIENDASYRAAGVYYIAVVASEFFGLEDFSAGIDVTYYAEDADDEVVVNYTEFFDCASGTQVDKLDIRNAMTLDATDTPESASIDAKIIELKADTEQIINDTSTDKVEILEAIETGTDTIVEKLVESHLLEET